MSCHHTAPHIALGTTADRDGSRGAEEFKEKIRTAMNEGKIADEDFNGDPEFNVLGKTGIRKAIRKAKPSDDDEEEGQQEGGEVCSVPLLEVTSYFD